VYCATKAGVHAFSQSLRYQLADTAVKVFEVVPPLVDTGMTQGQAEPKISPQTLAREVLQSLQRDRYEVHVGQTKGLLALHRFFPALVGSMVGNK
jgi:short-subunit dehydrogenase involved in D-alanine esterification of teichoic acids